VGARSPEALVSAARLLRRYHDATAGFAGRCPSGWMLPSRSPAEVICHGDFAPYNCVLDGERAVGMIDFDTAHPGPRVWDVAYCVYRWAPLSRPGNAEAFGTVAEQARQARLFCDAYGLPAECRRVLLSAAAGRLAALVDYMREQARAGHPSFQRHVGEGHDLLYLSDIGYFTAARDEIEAVLLPGDVPGGAGRDAGG
jgi:hypothetical protein